MIKKVLFVFTIILSLVVIIYFIVPVLMSKIESYRYSRYVKLDDNDEFDELKVGCDEIYLSLFDGKKTYEINIDKKDEISLLMNCLVDLRLEYVEKNEYREDKYSFGDLIVLRTSKVALYIELSLFDHKNLTIYGKYNQYIYKIINSNERLNEIIKYVVRLS